MREVGLSPAQIGLIFTAGGLGSFLGAWFGARVTDRFGYGRVLLITLLFGNTAPAGVVFGSAARTTLILFPVLFLAMGRQAMLVGAFGMLLATLWVACSAIPGLATIHEATQVPAS